MFRKNKLQVPMKQQQQAKSEKSQPRLIRRKSKDKQTYLKKHKTTEQIPEKQQSQISNTQSNIKFLSKYTKISGQASETKTNCQMNKSSNEKSVEADKLILSLNANNMNPFMSSEATKKSSKTQYFTVDSVYNIEQGKSVLARSQLAILQLQRQNQKLRQRNSNYETEINSLRQKIKDLIQLNQPQILISRVESINSQIKEEKSEISNQNISKGCNSTVCAECRHHLQLETEWRIQKQSLLLKIGMLEQKISKTESREVTELENDSRRSSIKSNNSQLSKQISGDEEKDKIDHYQRINTQLETQLALSKGHMKILQEQLNQNIQNQASLKSKIDKLYQQLKYTNIQNRTLLKSKTNLMKVEIENIKLRQERDQFKKKAIQNFKKIQELIKASRGNDSADSWSQNEDSANVSIESLTISSQSRRSEISNI